MNSTNRQTNYHFEYNILINNSQKKIWGLLTNVERWKEWDTEVIDSSLSVEFIEGAKGQLTPKNGPKLKFYISEVIPNKSYTFITKMPIGSLEIKRSLERKSGAIIFTDDIQFKGILKHLFGFILGGSFKAVLPEVMQNFKTLAEQE